MELGLLDNLLVRVCHHKARIEEVADVEFEPILFDYLEQELVAEAAEPDLGRIWIISELVRKNFVADRAIRCVRKWFDSRCEGSRHQKVGMIGGFLLQQLSPLVHEPTSGRSPSPKTPNPGHNFSAALANVGTA